MIPKYPVKVTDGEITCDLALLEVPQGSIAENGVAVIAAPVSTGFKMWAADMSQVSENAPSTDLVYLNQLSGDIVWEYNTVGTYTGTLAGAFPEGAVPTQGGIINFGAGTVAGTGTWKIARDNNDAVVLNTYQGNNPADGLLTGKYISFLVFDQEG